MNQQLLWLLCVPIPLGILAVWGVLVLWRNWDRVRW
jgi:hypothetical protein